jgi:hypothetical protein
MRYNSDVYEPKPFRFNNQWLDHVDFKSLVKGYWRDSNAMGLMRYILKEKLKGLKGVLKVWNKEVYE